jgi:hypothetical protein
MKRYGNLWSKIIAFENILLAAQKAQKGKRYKPAVLRFNRQFKYEVQHLEILPREAHRGSLVFITTKRLPYEL